MKNISVTFKIDSLPAYAIAHKEGRKTFEMQAYDGEAEVSVAYDYHRRPLTLRAAVKAGDELCAVLMPHRIELYVNGALEDEEWPAGNRLFALGDAVTASVPCTAREYAEPPKKEEPAVISRFEGAEGWRPGGHVYVGDCMPYVKEDEYHVLYLKDRHHHGSKWGLGAHQWEHLSTKDFKVWCVHPMAVPITEPWEASICTGSRIRHGQTEQLYYTVRTTDASPAPICRSISEDGYHFRKDPSFGFTLPERYTGESARDPKVILGEDGLYHMILTTTLKKERRGCLAHFVSRDLDAWEDVGEPIYVSADEAEPECPDYFKYNGRYYLIYSLHGVAHYLYSEKPFTDWRAPRDPVIPCASVPKGGIWEGKIVFTGFNRIRGYAGTLTFRSATANEKGELVFA